MKQTPESQFLGDVGIGLSPEESLKESKELLDKLHEHLESGVPLEDDEYGNYYEEPRIGELVKKQSSLRTLKRALTTEKEQDNQIPILRVGEKVLHPKRGKGIIVEAKKEDGKNIIAVEYSNGDIYDYQGGDEEIWNLFKKGQDLKPGDVVKRKDTTTNEEYTVEEKTPEGHVKVKNPRTNEETVVDPEFLEKKSMKPIYEKTAEDDEAVEEDEETEKPGISLEKSEETELELEDEEIEPEEESKTKIELPKIWTDVLKSVLLEGDNPKRVVEKLLDKIETSPEILSAVPEFSASLKKALSTGNRRIILSSLERMMKVRNRMF